MTKSVILSLLVSVFLLPCIPSLGQEIQMSVTAEAVPDAATKESFRFSGTITGSTLTPKDQRHIDNSVTVYVEYIDPGGKFRMLPDRLGGARYDEMKGDHKLTREEKSGIKAHGITIFGTKLGTEHEGKAVEFNKVVTIPPGAAGYRVVATLTHSWSGTWNAIRYMYAVQTVAIPFAGGGGVVDSNKPTVYYIHWIEGDEVDVDPKGTGDFQTLTKDMLPFKMFMHGKIITGFDSKAKISLFKNDVETVNELTNYSISDLITSRAGITARTSLKLGEVNIKIDPIFEEVDFSVSSPTCTVSIRGTELTVSHKESPMKTTVSVHSGKVEVTPRLCSEPAKILTAGQRITIDKNCFGDLEVIGPVAGNSIVKSVADGNDNTIAHHGSDPAVPEMAAKNMAIPQKGTGGPSGNSNGVIPPSNQARTVDRDTDDPVAVAVTSASTADARRAEQDYIAAYNKMTSLMAKGQGDTPAAQRAYGDYKAAKEKYEAAIKN